MAINSLTDIWEAVCTECKKSISELAFDCFLKDLKPVSLEGGVFVISINNEYMCNIIEQNYSEVLKQSLKAVMGIEIGIKVIFKDDEEAIQKAETENEGLSFEDFFTFENFIVGPSNQFSHTVCQKVVETPFNKDLNPLVLYGPSGVGKTHLMLAIKNAMQKKYPNFKVVYIRSEDFTNQLIRSLQETKIGMGSIQNFRNEFRSADVLLIDDIHFIAGKESTQEEFFNTFNVLIQSGKQMVFTVDRLPKDIISLEDRLCSRLESGVLAHTPPPDFETRAGILMQKANEANLPLADDLVYYIADNVRTNTRQLLGVIKKLSQLYLIQNKTPTLATVQNVIKEVMHETKPEPIKIETIISEVAKTYNLTEEEILSARKTASLVLARRVAMYIARKTTDLSFDKIGEHFGRDHATVLYNVNKIEEFLTEKPYERGLVEDIIKNLKSRNEEGY